jgi:MFS family permease
VANAPLALPHPAFAGWRVCTSGVVTQAIAIGFTLGAVGLFAAPLAEELGATATQFNLAVSLFMLVMNGAMPVIGGLLDRGSIRRVMFIGAFVLATSLALLSRATALWEVGVFFSVGCSIGMAMLGPMASSTAMANWFARMRGRALGIANAGGPLGPALIVPIAAYTIGEFGWRQTLLGFSVVTLLVALPAIRFGMIDHPKDVGQYPDGEQPEAVTAEDAAEGDTTEFIAP